MHFSDYRGSISALWATYFPCFAQYSRFGTSADFRYALTLFLFIMVGVILCIYKWVTYDYTTKRQKYFNKDDNLFAREFFNMWDFRTKRDNDAKHSVEGIQTVIKIMVHEEKIKEEVKNRTASQKWTLYFIRGCLITLSILILILGWTVIIFANLYESNITSYWDSITGLKQISQYIAAISLTVVNYIVPKTLGWITDWEKWDFAHDKLKQEIWRNYLAQMVNFLVFLVLQAELVLNKAFFRSSSIISFTNVNKNSTQYDWREDYVALSLFKLFIVELIQRYLYYFGWIIYYRLKASCQRLNNWRKEFEVSDEVVWLIYFQSVIWAGFLYYPFLALLSPIVMYLHFKFIFFRLRRWKIPPNEMNSNLASRSYSHFNSIE